MPRVAGLFEAPPAMLKAFMGWAVPLYAGHVLAQVDERLALLRDAEGTYERALVDLRKQHSDAPRIVDSLDVGESHIFRYYRIRAGDGKIVSFLEGVRRDPDGVPYGKSDPVKLFSHAEGKKQVRFKPRGGRYTLKSVLYRTQSPLESSTAELERELRALQRRPVDVGPSLVESTLLRRACLKYTTKAKHYTSRTKTKLPVDLTGWKYSVTGKDLVEVGYAYITCILNFKGRISKGGVWYDEDRELQVDVQVPQPQTVEEFQEGLRGLLLIADHEMKHVGQSVFQAVKGLKEIAGLPGAEMRDPSKDPMGFLRSLPPRLRDKWHRDDHAEQDAEFYTDLGDEVVHFMHTSRKVSQKDWDKLFRAWVYLTPVVTLGRERVSPSKFFSTLKRTNKAKWVKAVGEFMKAVEKEGFRAPSSFRVASRHTASHVDKNNGGCRCFVYSSDPVWNGNVQSMVVVESMKPRASVQSTTTCGAQDNWETLHRTSLSQPHASTRVVGNLLRSGGSVEHTTTFCGDVETPGLLQEEDLSLAMSKSAPSNITLRGIAKGTTICGNAKEILSRQSGLSRDLDTSTKMGTGLSMWENAPSWNTVMSCLRSWVEGSSEMKLSTTSTGTNSTTTSITLKSGFGGIHRGNGLKTRLYGPVRSSNATDICIQRVAKRWVQGSYFNIGDEILYGKWKNARGVIVAAYLDEKGHPVVEIEPVPKGRKQNKVVQLYRIWHAPAAPKMAGQDWGSPSCVRVAQAHDEGSKDFFDNPQRSSVLDFALSNAITNEPGVAQQSMEDGLISPKEEERVDQAPLTPSESVQEPGGNEFSTLSQYLITTETPTIDVVPQGFDEIPKAKNLAQEGQ